MTTASVKAFAVAVQVYVLGVSKRLTYDALRATVRMLGVPIVIGPAWEVNELTITGATRRVSVCRASDGSVRRF